MNNFAEVFGKIDKSGKGYITIDELKRYKDENNLEASFIPTWQNLFDPQGTGKITWEKFRTTLGLSPNAVQPKSSGSVNAGQEDTLKPLVIKNLMINRQEEDIYTIISQMRKEGVPKEMFTSELRKRLDQKFGDKWQVVILEGSYRSSITHDENMCCIFKDGPEIFMLWRIDI